MFLLGVHSHFSLMWGTASPAQLVAAAKKLGYRGLALTDLNNLYGLWPFLQACRLEQMQPIVGAEITDPRCSARAYFLVENNVGYANLCRLLSARHLDEKFSLGEAVPQFAEGLIILCAVPELLEKWARLGLARHNRLAAAVVRQPNNVHAKLRSLARSLSLPWVALDGSFFLSPDDHEIHQLLRAIALNTSLSRLPPKEVAAADAHLFSPAARVARFALLPEALEAAPEIASRCAQFFGPQLGTVLPPWSSSNDVDQELRQAAFAGATCRYGDDLPEPVVDRLNYELRIIAAKKFSSYFLVVREIISRSPRICGRGSGAASLVAYCLGITNVCPIKHNLYFERFLNPGRIDPPDIDVDFSWDERDEVINSVLNKYAGHSAMVCNHVAMQPRMAIREVAKVFGLTDGEIGQVTKRLPYFWHALDDENDLQKRLVALPEMQAIDFPDPWPRILRLAQKIVGTPRCLSVHPGGIVITPQPLDSYVPLERAPKGVPIIQWEKDATEESGLVKIDLLGNRSLGVIRDALANVQLNHLVFDEQHWQPEDDLATQAAVAAGQTMGCFYIESPAMRQLQRKTGRGDFEHLVIHSSIIRPAANEFIREYVRRLRGGSWQPLHPLLTDVLDETYGIMVYQEDVSKTAMALAGFDHVAADGLRKILSKKDRELKLRDYHARFFAGAKERGVDEPTIERAWQMILSFDGYSFCKPHSASYARVSFQAAYLKVHFPAEFLAAVISNQGGFYSSFAYVSEARRLGLRLLPPDVNQSEIRWRGAGRTLRVGLLSLKDLSGATMARLIDERTSNGPYLSLENFLARVRPSVDETRALIFAHAFDSLDFHGRPPDPALLLWQLAAHQHQTKHTAQTLDLFAPDLAPQTLPPLPAADSPRDNLREEFRVLGFLLDRHPLSLYQPQLAKLRPSLVRATELSQHIGQKVRLAGLLITGKLVTTKHGEPMEFVTFEDESGLIETTFFPQTYRRFCARLNHHQPFLLTGKVEEDYGALTVNIEDVAAFPTNWR